MARANSLALFSFSSLRLIKEFGSDKDMHQMLTTMVRFIDAIFWLLIGSTSLIRGLEGEGNYR